MSSWYTVVIALVALERLAELVVAQRNARWSFAHGGVEFGQRHYPPMVALHIGLLLGCLVEAAPSDRDVRVALAGTMGLLALLSQVLRWWCIASLGNQWNTRVIVVPNAPTQRRGPYRFLKHPNYVAVAVEGIALPLMHANWITATVFTVLNAWLLSTRIRVENRALTLLAEPHAA